MEEILKVLDIFTEYYGEDRIELKDNSVIVYFPKVTVTNENDRSTDITELYVKININGNGTMEGTFCMTRSEYTFEQYYSDYCHSHVNGIQNPNTFKSVCLGIGPIRNTCASLNISFDEDIWRLFVFELDKYVHTESLEGGPYRLLERIGCPHASVLYRRIDIPDYNSDVILNSVLLYVFSSTLEVLNNMFIPYVINSKPFRFSYSGRYSIADSPYTAVVKISNLFIEWYNGLTHEEQGNIKSELFQNNVLMLARLDGAYIYKSELPDFDYSIYRKKIGTFLFTFKGEAVTLNITGIPDDTEIKLEEEENTSVILNPVIVMYIVKKILKIINYRYGNKRTSSDKKTVYL